MLFAASVADLERRLAELPSLLVALSGGVDSAVLLGMAMRAVRGRVVAATASSPAVPAEEIAAARAVADRFGATHVVLKTGEMADPRYRANAGDRCYFCRLAMYGAMRELAGGEGLARIADGLQLEDLGDDRPGRRAAAEAGVLHPLRDAGLDKPAVRRLARALGLAIHEKPAQPCLSSRLPPGVEVTLDRLRRVHKAESALRELGYRQVRVRCEDSHGRIEIGGDELGRALEEAARLEATVREAGFGSATLDSEGYRVGGAYR